MQARDILGQKHHVVSVIGDGALTGGMAYEALNNAAELKTNFIIIINDNNMSISRNVGGMSTYLSALRTAEAYTGMKMGVTKAREESSESRHRTGRYHAKDQKQHQTAFYSGNAVREYGTDISGTG